MSLAQHIGEQVKSVNVNPTEAQKLAGNYRKAHIRVHGLDISIENPKGSMRSGKSPNGRTWQSRLPHHYGYIRRTEGADGDHVDVFIGPHLKSPYVFAIDQHRLHDRGFDEHKIFIGFGNKAQAVAAYARAFSDGKGRNRIGHVETMSIDQFKSWLRDGDTMKPIKRRAEGGRVMSDDEVFGAVPMNDEAVFGKPAAAPKSIGDRISHAWEKASPGGPLWMAREAWRGVRGSVEGSAAARAPQVGTEGEEMLRRKAEEEGPGAALQAVQFMSPGAPGGGMLAVPRAGVAPGPAAAAPEVLANKGVAGEFNIPLSKGQATQDLDAIRFEDLSARGAYGKPAQDRAATFFDDQYGATQDASKGIARGMATPRGPVEDPNEAAAVLSSEIAERAAQAKTIVDGLVGRSESEATAQRGMVADQGRTLTDTVRGPAQPIENPREMGEVVGQNVREAAAANRAERTGLYNEVRDLPGEFRVDAVRGIGTRVRNQLDVAADPIIIDDQLTPVASRAIQALDEMSIPRIQNRASPHAEPDPSEIAGVSLRGIDQMRKKLIAYYTAARSNHNNPTDARAVRAVIEGFDGQIERAITEGLFSGDPRALAALQAARASHTRYKNTFGPQRPDDDVGTAMRRIVERNATPEETANMIMGSGKLGAAGTPVRLADRLEQVLGAGSDSWSAIRQAMWQKASQVRNTAGEIDPGKSAQSILDFVGSSLAARMFTPQERAAMRSHARGVRELEQAIASHPAAQDAERAQTMYRGAFGGEGIGGQQQAVFRRIIDGTATPEEVSGAVFTAIGAGNPGNVARLIGAIERVVGSQSESMAALRQGVWQRTTMNPDGRSGMGMQRVVNNIAELLHGKGASVARALYTEEQRAMMDRYAQALRLTIIPKYARTNSDTTPAVLGALRKYGTAIMASLGSILSGGAEGGFAGIGVKHLLEKGGERFTELKAARKVGRSLDNLDDPPKPSLPPKKGLPLYLMQRPTSGQSVVNNAASAFRGSAPGHAEDKKKQP